MDKLSISLLKAYKERSSLSVYDISVLTNADMMKIADVVNELRQYEYIAVNSHENISTNDPINPNTQLHITRSGESFLYNHAMELNTKRFDLFFKIFTLILSTAAIIISIIALLKP